MSTSTTVAPAGNSATCAVPSGVNIAIVRGVIRSEPEYRSLPSGDEVLSFDLSVRRSERGGDTVPVVWHNPPTSSVRLAEGSDVVVVGCVRRRFFRSAGTTASRTEVHADTVVGARAAVRIRSALVSRLEEISLD